MRTQHACQETHQKHHAQCRQTGWASDSTPHPGNQGQWLARLTEDSDLRELATWMDWRLPNGLETPAPVEFLGGTHEMPAGEIAYFRVRLEPGDYAWIAEVANPDEKGMLKTFTVSGE